MQKSASKTGYSDQFRNPDSGQHKNNNLTNKIPAKCEQIN